MDVLEEEDRVRRVGLVGVPTRGCRIVLVLIPIFCLQSGHSGELPKVVSDNRQVPRQRQRRDQQVPLADGAPNPLEIKADSRIRVGCYAIERKHVKRLQEGIDLPAHGHSARALACAKPQLRQRDGRDRDLARPMFPHAPRPAPDA